MKSNKMELNKTYTSKVGIKRTPLSFTECGRFVITETVCKNSILIKTYWKIIFEERIKSGVWNG